MKRSRKNIAVENQVQGRKSKTGETTSLVILGKSKQRKIFHTSLTNAQFCVFVFVVLSYNCIYLAKISWESRRYLQIHFKTVSSFFGSSCERDFFNKMRIGIQKSFH